MKHHQKTIIVIIMLLWNCLAGAQQVITGIVCDKTSKMPVSDVYLIIGGTSIYAVTDVSGRFELKATSLNNAKMVLYHVSYHDVVIDNPFDEHPDTLYIVERINEMSEIVVTASNKKVKIIKRVVKVEIIKEGLDSISHLKLIRSSGYPTIDARALRLTRFTVSLNRIKIRIPNGKPVRAVHTFHFDKNCPTCDKTITHRSIARW